MLQAEGYHRPRCASKYWLVVTASKLRQWPLIGISTHCGGHFGALCRRHDYYAHRSVCLFLNIFLFLFFACSKRERDCFLFLPRLSRDPRAAFSCGFRRDGVRLGCRDTTFTGAVRRSWRTAGLTGYIYNSLEAKRAVCTTTTTTNRDFQLRPNPNFSPGLCCSSTPAASV